MSHSADPMERSLPTTPRGKKTRQLLLDAAEEVFGRVPYEQASVAEITKRADVALGTFYVYFPHKLAIFIELVDELGARLRMTLREATREQSDRIAMERAGLLAFLRFCAKHRNLYRIVRQAEFVDLETHQRYYRTLAEAYARGLARAMERGQIARLNPELLSYALMGIGDFIGMRFAKLGRDEAAREKIVDELMPFLREGLLPR